MRRSSRITYFLGLSVFLVSAANAGGMRGSGIGYARGLSPIRPIVGTSRGLSPTALQARHGIERPWGRRFATAYGAGDYGLADGGLPGVTAGVMPGIDPDGEDGLGPDRGPYRVIMAPPRPCVAPRIITISKSREDRRVAAPPRVQVVYGVPGCGRF